MLQRHGLLQFGIDLLLFFRKFLQPGAADLAPQIFHSFFRTSILCPWSSNERLVLSMVQLHLAPAKT